LKKTIDKQYPTLFTTGKPFNF